MPDGPAQSISMSHARTDQAIAHAVRNAVQSLFGDAVAVRYSTNKELDGGIRPGEDWFRWIGQQIREAEVAAILLTPASARAPAGPEAALTPRRAAQGGRQGGR